MRSLLVHQFVTVDGVVQGPGHPEEDQDGGFLQGGWVPPLWHDDIGVHVDAWVKRADALLLGRKTWQGHGGAFEPNPDQDPFAGLRKYVVSRTLRSVEAWRNSELVAGEPLEAVRGLKAQPGKAIALDGSISLMHLLLEHDLIDELYLHVFPISVGGGKRLFPSGKTVNLQLLDSRSLPNGVVHLHYAVGAPRA